MYSVFARTMWIRNADWPEGLEPGFGHRRKITTVNTIEEAREACADYMATHYFSKEDKVLGLAAEFEEL